MSRNVDNPTLYIKEKSLFITFITFYLMLALLGPGMHGCHDRSSMVA